MIPLHKNLLLNRQNFVLPNIIFYVYSILCAKMIDQTSLSLSKKTI